MSRQIVNPFRDDTPRSAEIVNPSRDDTTPSRPIPRLLLPAPPLLSGRSPGSPSRAGPPSRAIPGLPFPAPPLPPGRSLGSPSRRRPGPPGRSAGSPPQGAPQGVRKSHWVSDPRGRPCENPTEGPGDPRASLGAAARPRGEPPGPEVSIAHQLHESLLDRCPHLFTSIWGSLRVVGILTGSATQGAPQEMQAPVKVRVW